MSWANARRIRQGVQVISFVIYVGLLFWGVEKRVAPVLADLFFRLDPLAGLGAMLASRTWMPRLGLGLLTLLLTVLVGRAWCGWICPLGSLLEWVSFRRSRKRAFKLSSKWRTVKYFLLVMVLVGALSGSLALMVFDPLTILTRSMTTAVIPALVLAINAIEKLLYRFDILSPLLDGIESVLRGKLLPVTQPAFNQNLFIALLFAGILAANWLAPRFWCRYLCPLGALLGWVSKISLLRPLVGEKCNQCTRCALICNPGAIDTDKEGGFKVMPSECTACLDCLAGCKQMDIHYRLNPKPAPQQEFDLSRREFLGAVASGTLGALLLATELRRKHPNTYLIRPPGAQDEDEFLSRCLRCSQCMKICPTSALQPALSEGGLAGLWTPVLVPRAGYCDYGCTACGQVCPSGAIPLLSLEEKRQQVIGKASINRDRCLPWASGITCIVCEEMCPTPQKAIRLEEEYVTDAQGEEVFLQKPYVLRELCIGCGICENHCPLEGEAAIRVYRV